tara:strand:+ start:1673 stop:1852 length:180 start_codon:yes stop_codon:yes gene_type:complete
MKNTVIYFAGDKVRLTGKTYEKHGENWAEFEWIEGHKKGQLGACGMSHWTFTTQIDLQS